MQLPEPFSFIFTWFAAVPFLVWLALTLTNAVVRDSLILKVVIVPPLFLFLPILQLEMRHGAILTEEESCLGTLSELWN